MIKYIVGFQLQLSPLTFLVPNMVDNLKNFISNNHATISLFAKWIPFLTRHPQTPGKKKEEKTLAGKDWPCLIQFSCILISFRWTRVFCRLFVFSLINQCSEEKSYKSIKKNSLIWSSCKLEPITKNNTLQGMLVVCRQIKLFKETEQLTLSCAQQKSANQKLSLNISMELAS